MSREVAIGPEDWVQAALVALGEEGEAGVAVEPLARRLGVTKGSFYWHFDGRDALWAALLDAFEGVGTEEPIARLSAIADPRERLRGLFATAFDTPLHLRAHRALFASARPDVRQRVAAVHARREAFLRGCYLDLGLPPAEAEAWAATVYATFCGAVLLVDREPFADSDTLRGWVEHLGRVAIP